MTAPFDPRGYWEDRLRHHFTPAGAGYLRLGRRYNEWMYRVRARVFDRVARALPVAWAAAEVLDVGSGTGFYVERWKGLGVRRVTGLDLTAVAAAHLAARFPADRFLQADIGGPREQLPLEPEGFEAASAMDVLFHLVDDAAYRRAFHNLAALLKPGGWLLWSDNFVRHGTERTVHQVSRSLASSEAAVGDAGLEIVRRVPMFMVMNYPADTRSRLRRLLWAAMVAPAALAEPLGWLVGAALYPLELRLTARAAEGPTTELMVCRKPGR